MYIIISIVAGVAILLAVGLSPLKISADKPPYIIYKEKPNKDSFLKLKAEYSNYVNRDETLAVTMRYLSQFIECEPRVFKGKYFEYLKGMNYTEDELYTLVKRYSLLTRIESHELKFGNPLTHQKC